MGRDVGAIEVGRYADAIVLKKNPLHAIDCLGSLDNISTVFKDGRAVTGKVDTSQWSPASPLGPG